MITKAVYLICAPMLFVGIVVVVAAGAALVSPPNVMLQATVVAPVSFLLTSSVLGYFLRRYVIPHDQQAPSFRFFVFWGNVVLLLFIAVVLLGAAFFGLVTLIEGMVASLVAFVAGQYWLISFLQTTPTVYDVFD